MANATCIHWHVMLLHLAWSPLPRQRAWVGYGARGQRGPEARGLACRRRFLAGWPAPTLRLRELRRSSSRMRGGRSSGGGSSIPWGAGAWFWS